MFVVAYLAAGCSQSAKYEYAVWVWDVWDASLLAEYLAVENLHLSYFQVYLSCEWNVCRRTLLDNDGQSISHSGY